MLFFQIFVSVCCGGGNGLGGRWGTQLLSLSYSLPLSTTLPKTLGRGFFLFLVPSLPTPLDFIFLYIFNYRSYFKVSVPEISKCLMTLKLRLSWYFQLSFKGLIVEPDQYRKSVPVVVKRAIFNLATEQEQYSDEIIFFSLICSPRNFEESDCSFS